MILHKEPQSARDVPDDDWSNEVQRLSGSIVVRLTNQMGRTDRCRALAQEWLQDRPYGHRGRGENGEIRR